MTNKALDLEGENDTVISALDDVDSIEVEISDDDNFDAPKTSEDVSPVVPTEDEIAGYSAGVQKRIKKMTFDIKEAERHKAEAIKVREEAVNYAKTIHEENERLKKTLEQGEGVIVDQAKRRIVADKERARAAYKEAYDLGDSDAMIAANEKLNAINNEEYRVARMKPQQRPTSEFKLQQTQEVAQEPDQRTKEWSARNEWFGPDKRMTGFAFGVHEELVTSGVAAGSDDYYEKIDEAMRSAFPSKFNAGENKRDVVTSRKTGNVVAPANRSTNKSRTVTLSPSQASLAKRLGLSNEQYAAQALKESRNG